MLTLDRPIRLVVREAAPVFSDSFGKRISANYEIMTASFSQEELLFLLVNPPEIPYAEGDSVYIALGGARRDTQNFILSIVNNVVNRVLLSDESKHSYQDTVYLDMALRKLGARNIASFMEQVRVLRAENLSAHTLERLYESNLRTLRESLARETEFRGRAVKAAEAKDEAQGKDRTLYLYDEIYKRLDTAKIVRALARFARESSETETRVDAREMRIAEMRRSATVLALNEYRREIPAFGAGDVYYNRNLYETGDILEAPADEKSVLGQALTASLLQIIDNVTTIRAELQTREREVWIDVADALRASARDSVERYLSFRESAAAGARRPAPADLRTLALLTRSEGEILSRHIAALRVYDESRRARGTEIVAVAEADTEAAREARPEAAAAREARDRVRGTLLELARVYSERLRASEMPARRARDRVTEEGRVASLPFAVADASPKSSEESERLAPDAIPFTHAARDIATGEAAAGARDARTDADVERALLAKERTEAPAADAASVWTLARALDAGSDSARVATDRDAETYADDARVIFPYEGEVPAPRVEARAADAETDEAKASRAGETAAPGSEMLAAALSRVAGSAPFGGAPERTETVFTESERETILLAQEQRAREARDRPADTEAPRGGEGGESAVPQSEAALREVLDRIDRENKERLTYLRETRTETRAAIPPSQPDKRRIMRDALRAIENPAQVISETLEREVAASRAGTPAGEEPFVYADEGTRKTLELLRLLQTDPAAAAAAGVTVAQGPEALIEDIAAVERERAERAAETEARAERAVFRESTERLTFRRVALSESPQSAPAPQGPAAWETAPPIVHRRTPAPDIEALLQRREQRVTEDRSRRDETTERAVRMNEIRTQDEQITREITTKSAEDIAEMVNTTLMGQIGTIADKVYGQLEKKLQNEKSRRGRM